MPVPYGIPAHRLAAEPSSTGLLPRRDAVSMSTPGGGGVDCRRSSREAGFADRGGRATVTGGCHGTGGRSRACWCSAGPPVLVVALVRGTGEQPQDEAKLCGAV